MIKPTHVVFSQPRRIDGVFHRGFMATDYPKTLDSQIDRSLWAVGFFLHAAIQPSFNPEIDLYFASDTYVDCPSPRINITDRDLTDENVFFPYENTEKQFDVIFNATWMPVKRHELLIDALRYAMGKGRPLRCLWFGYHYCDESIERELTFKKVVVAEDLGVTFAETNFDRAEVNRRFNRSRACLICSQREGGPRVMGESLLANVPFVVTEDTEGGAPQMINDQIGITCEATGQGIAEAVWQIIDQADVFSPRDWALEHMCVRKTIPRLREFVRKISAESNVPINCDDIGFHGYDWECTSGEARKVEADFAAGAATHPS